MWFSVDYSSHIPVYRQIMDKLKEKVITGEIKMGEFIPSIRALAKSLGVNVNTVARAYRELEREGIIESVRGEGYIVVDINRNEIKNEILKNLKFWLEKGKILGISKEELFKVISEVYENEK